MYMLERSVHMNFLVALSNLTSQCIHQHKHRQHNRLNIGGWVLNGQIRFKRAREYHLAWN